MANLAQSKAPERRQLTGVNLMHRATLHLCSTLAVLSLLAASAWPANDSFAADETLTQLDLNQDADSAFKAADAELNRVYQEIRRRYRDQPRFLDKLKLAQRAWLKFRDAELDALYPPTADGDPYIAYGSMYPMCYASAMERLTKERTAQLRRWLDGVEEGDTCTGSIR